jgi:hypothetical protein
MPRGDGTGPPGGGRAGMGRGIGRGGGGSGRMGGNQPGAPAGNASVRIAESVYPIK